MFPHQCFRNHVSSFAGALSWAASRFRSMEFQEFYRCHKWACLFNFPVSRALGTRLKGRPEILSDSIGCNFESRASQVGLHVNRRQSTKSNQ